MASPQKENGYAPIANEILDAAARFGFPGAQIAIVLLLWRDIYGWKGRRKTPPLGLRAMAERLNLPRGTVQRALNSLLEAQVVSMDGGNVKGRCWRFNKDFDQWRAACGQLPLITSGGASPSIPPGMLEVARGASPSIPPGMPQVAPHRTRAFKAILNQSSKQSVKQRGAAVDKSPNGARIRCAYSDQGQGACAQETADGRRFCLHHSLKVADKATAKTQRSKKTLSAAEIVAARR